MIFLRSAIIARGTTRKHHRPSTSQASFTYSIPSRRLRHFSVISIGRVAIISWSATCVMPLKGDRISATEHERGSSTGASGKSDRLISHPLLRLASRRVPEVQDLVRLLDEGIETKDPVPSALEPLPDPFAGHCEIARVFDDCSLQCSCRQLICDLHIRVRSSRHLEDQVEDVGALTSRRPAGEVPSPTLASRCSGEIRHTGGASRKSSNILDGDLFGRSDFSFWIADPLGVLANCAGINVHSDQRSVSFGRRRLLDGRLSRCTHVASCISNQILTSKFHSTRFIGKVKNESLNKEKIVDYVGQRRFSPNSALQLMSLLFRDYSSLGPSETGRPLTRWFRALPFGTSFFGVGLE